MESELYNTREAHRMDIREIVRGAKEIYILVGKHLNQVPVTKRAILQLIMQGAFDANDGEELRIWTHPQIVGFYYVG